MERCHRSGVPSMPPFHGMCLRNSWKICWRCVLQTPPVRFGTGPCFLLSARLGLRPSEVLRLRLQDLDWTTGSVLIRAGKTSRERLLPLPEDAGAALASYLREGRPVSTERAVFLTCGPAHPPIRGNGFTAKLVNRLLRQAGFGASFKEVADILGHGSLTTTGIYAKLDLPSLAQVALPWPGGAQ